MPAGSICSACCPAQQRHSSAARLTPWRPPPATVCADYYGRLASAWGRGLANYLGEGAGAVPPEGDLIYSSGGEKETERNNSSGGNQPLPAAGSACTGRQRLPGGTTIGGAGAGDAVPLRSCCHPRFPQSDALGPMHTFCSQFNPQPAPSIHAQGSSFFPPSLLAEAHEDVSAEGGVGTDISAFMLDPSNPEQVIAVM